MANDEIVIDERFFLPPNVVDLRRRSEEEGAGYYVPSIPSSSSPIVEEYQGTAPVAPTSFTVISQIVRTTADGKQVVDITLELPDQDGVLEYDVRVAKT